MKLHIFIACGLSTLISCASIPKKPGFEPVQSGIEQKTGYQIQWNQSSKEDQLVAQKIDSLISTELNIDEVVQITLLNNQRLQMVYQDLGIAQAAVVQAGLLRNPVFSGALGFPFNGGSPDLVVGASFNFLDFLYIPMRKSIARSNFEAAKARVKGAVLDKIAQTKFAYFRLQADQQNLELQEQITLAMEASYHAAEKLYEAGNIIELNYRNEQALYERAKADLTTAQIQLVQSREALHRMMGLSADKKEWKISDRLSSSLAHDYKMTTIEAAAIDSSLDLAAVGEEITALGRSLGLTKRTSLFPQVELGGEVEREDGEWEIGPEASISIPLFDQGQARNAVARSRLIQKQQEYAALIIEIQSRARELMRELDGIKSVVEQYQSTLLPLQAAITQQTQAQYNAMQTGVFELLQAKQQEIQTGRSYIKMLEAYWMIHTDLELLVLGRNSLLSNNINLDSALMGASIQSGGH